MKLHDKVMSMHTVVLFHTPETKEYLEKWVYAHRDPRVTTAYMMTYNFIISKLRALAEEDLKELENETQYSRKPALRL